SAQCAAPPCYCNTILGSRTGFCTAVSPGLCGCGRATVRQGCLSNVVAQGGTVMEDIFRTSDGRDARGLRFARYLRGLGSNPSGTCPVGETAVRSSCDGTGASCLNERDATTLAAFANSLDWRWVLEQRVNSAGAAVVDGDSSSFYPWRSVIYDLGTSANRVVVFPVVDPSAQAAGTAVNACSGPLALTVWMTDNPAATRINTSRTPDPDAWNAARLIVVFTEGWTRNAASTGGASDTTDYATTSGGSASGDGMVTEWQVACGANFRYTAITAGFQGGGAALNPCAQGRVRNLIDAVAGLDEEGSVPGIDHVLPFGESAGPDAFTGVPTPAADVYFLADASASMAPSLANVRNAISSTGEFFPGCPGGIMEGVRCVMPDSWFGVGQVQDFPVAPYGVVGRDQYYRHVLDMSSDTGAASGAVAGIVANGADSGFADPLEAQVPALWSLATGHGIHGVGVNGASVDYLADRGPCMQGSVGYPCFRTETLPVVLHFTDRSQYHNGPGATAPYDEYALSGSAPLVYPLFGTFSNGSDAYAIGTTPFLSGSPPQTIFGSTSGFANDDRSAVCGGAGRDVVYQFDLAAPSRVHVDTTGTLFSTPILYVRNAAGAQLGCSAATSASQATLDLDLPAGSNYELWVDSVNGAGSGPFEMHFGVRASPPAAIPVWQDAVDALNAIGAGVITVDSSGVATPNDSASIANSTSAIGPTGAAYRFATDGTMSNLASVTVGDNSIVGAILDRARAASRMNVYAVAVDNPATAVNESRFVNSPAVTTATTASIRLSGALLGEASPYPGTSCTGTTGTPGYMANGCLAGTAVQFRADWSNRIVPSTGVVQEFHFDIVVYGSHGETEVELARVPVTLYVPAVSYPPTGSATFHLAAPTCAPGELWRWASLQFDVDAPPARTPACTDPGTRVQFSAQTGWTAGAADAALPVVLGTAPCSASPIDLGAALIASGVSDRLSYLTLTLTLSSYDGLTPTVRGYNVLGNCEPAL
ncbi:MAG: hypothetical protein WCJ30_08105, partial [Deltaproteobacteria bacterium]